MVKLIVFFSCFFISIILNFAQMSKQVLLNFEKEAIILIGKEEFGKAISKLEKALDMRKEDHDVYKEELSQLIGLCYAQSEKESDIIKALEYFQKAERIQSHWSLDDAPATYKKPEYLKEQKIKSLFYFGLIYKKLSFFGDPKKAKLSEKYYKKALELAKKTHNINFMAATYNGLGVLYGDALGNLKEAKKHYLLALDGRRKQFSKAVAQLPMQDKTLLEKGKLPLSLQKIVKSDSKISSSKIYGGWFVNSLNQEYYIDERRFIILLKQIKGDEYKIIKHLSPTDLKLLQDRKFSSDIIKLSGKPNAIKKVEKGWFIKAEKGLFAIRIIDRLIASKVKSSLPLVNAYNSIGDYYISNSLSRKAIPYLERAREYLLELPTTKRVLHKKSEVMYTLGIAYSNMLKRNTALRILEKAKEIKLQMIEQLEKPREIVDASRYIKTLADTYNAIGTVQKNLFEFKYALEAHEEALKLRKELKSNDQGESLVNIGNIYGSLGQFDKAFGKYNEAAAFLQKKYKKNHSKLLLLDINRSEYYALKKQQDQQKLLEYLKKLEQMSFDGNQYHRYQWLKLRSMALIYFRLSNYEKSIESALEAYKIARELFKNEYSFLSTNDRIFRFKYEFHRLHSLFLSILEKHYDEDLVKIAYSSAIYQKEFVNLILLQEKKYLALDPKVREMIDLLVLYDKEIYQLKLKRNNNELSEIKRKRDELFVAIRRKSPESENLVKIPKLKSENDKESSTLVERIQNKLVDNYVHIEYSSFKNYSRNDTWIGVFLVKKGSITFRSLSKETIISSNVESLNQAILQGKKLNKIAPHERSDALSKELKKLSKLSHKLYSIIWQGFENYLENVEYISISPDSSLHNSLFLCLSSRPDSFEPLIKKFAISRVSSGNTLLTNYESLGDGFYGVTKPNYDWNFQKENILLPPNREKLKSIPHSDFSGMKKTIEKLSTSKPVYKKGDEATVEHFFYNVAGKRWVFISTHSKYRKSVGERLLKKFDEYRNALTLVQIAFAGANVSPYLIVPNTGKKYDGFLSSGDLGLCSLSSCQLGVFLGCESAQGLDFQGVGQYSLRWAYEQAGGNYLITALLEIPNVASKKIITDCYKYIVEGEPVFQAFRLAQLTFMKDQKEEYQLHPFYWASLILQGNHLQDITK